MCHYKETGTCPMHASNVRHRSYSSGPKSAGIIKCPFLNDYGLMSLRCTLPCPMSPRPGTPEPPCMWHGDRACYQHGRNQQLHTLRVAMCLDDPPYCACQDRPFLAIPVPDYSYLQIPFCSVKLLALSNTLQCWPPIDVWRNASNLLCSIRLLAGAPTTFPRSLLITGNKLLRFDTAGPLRVSQQECGN